MASINPFKGIIKTDIAPHNRTLRTSFGWKLQDAFTVFFGAPCKANAGVFDLCTLGIPLAIHQAWCWCLNQENPWISYPLGFLVGLINVPLLIPRILVAAICVLNPISLIVTGVVHFISQYIAEGEALKKEAFKLVLSDTEGHKINLDEELVPLNYWSNGENYSTPTFLSLENFRIQIEGNTLKVKQVFVSAEVACLPSALIKHRHIGDNFCYLPIFKDGQVVKHGENLKALKALMQLNVGNVTENLEKTLEGKELLKNIMAAPAA